MRNRYAETRGISPEACGQWSRRLFVGLTATAACACADPVVPLCDFLPSPAVTVEITDAQSGTALVERAVGVLRDGAFTDSLELCGGAVASRARCGAYERIGTYDVEVQQAGYQSWSARGVQVSKGTCHVNTVTLKAALIPEP